MYKTITMAILLASATLTTPALAEGDYYEGVHRNEPVANTPRAGISLGEQTRTFYFPRSDAAKSAWNTTRDNRTIGDSGDYYEGATRPH